MKFHLYKMSENVLQNIAWYCENIESEHNYTAHRDLDLYIIE